MHYILITVTSFPTSPRSIPYSIISQLYVLSLSSRILWSAICVVIYIVLSMQPSTGMVCRQLSWGHTIGENQCSSPDSYQLPIGFQLGVGASCQHLPFMLEFRQLELVQYSAPNGISILYLFSKGSENSQKRQKREQKEWRSQRWWMATMNPCFQT